MYNDVRNLFNALHNTVFKNYEIEKFNVGSEHIILRSIVNCFFLRIDFDGIQQYYNTIQFSGVDYQSTDEIPFDDFNKNAYFDAVMLNIPLTYEDVLNISHNASMFAKATGRSVRVYISRERPQTKR